MKPENASFAFDRFFEHDVFAVHYCTIPALLTEAAAHIESYKSDLLHDAMALATMPIFDEKDEGEAGAPFVWAIRDAGTHLVSREVWNMYYDKETGNASFASARDTIRFHVWRENEDTFVFKRLWSEETYMLLFDYEEANREYRRFSAYGDMWCTYHNQNFKSEEARKEARAAFEAAYSAAYDAMLDALEALREVGYIFPDEGGRKSEGEYRYMVEVAEAESCMGYY